MKFVLISDIHIDANAWNWAAFDQIDRDVDTLVVAGDISNDIWEVSRWLVESKKRFNNVVWVAGNHDFYNLGFHQTRMFDKNFDAIWPYPKTVNEIIEHYKRWSTANGITFLHRNSVKIDGVTFVGVIGWHDYRAGHPYSTDEQIAVWYQCLNDTQIYWQENGVVDHRFPLDAGIKDVSSLQHMLDKSSGPVVIITHHVPHTKLCWQQPHNRIWTMLHGSFANTRMEKVKDQKIRYWVYGHTHNRGMTDIDQITYVCNAKGYRGENPHWEPIVLEL